MRELFSKLDLSQFAYRFSDNDSCLQYLADLKWQNGYKCRKCGHTNFCKGKMKFSRRCTKCKYDESPTVHTIFHRCKINLRDAFEIAYQVCYNSDISTYKLAETIDSRQMTCWKFKKKLQKCIEENGMIVLYE